MYECSSEQNFLTFLLWLVNMTSPLLPHMHDKLSQGIPVKVFSLPLSTPPHHHHRQKKKTYMVVGSNQAIQYECIRVKKFFLANIHKYICVAGAQMSHCITLWFC